MQLLKLMEVAHLRPGGTPLSLPQECALDVYQTKLDEFAPFPDNNCEDRNFPWWKKIVCNSF